jgi:hypothetical protein
MALDGARPAGDGGAVPERCASWRASRIASAEEKQPPWRKGGGQAMQFAGYLVW